MNWLAQFFCRHDWITKFRGQYTRGVECSICGKVTLLVDKNNGSEPVGWIADEDRQ